MSWKTSPKIANILDKAKDNSGIDWEDAVALMYLDLCSKETYALMQTANELSKLQFNNKGENHFHIGINVEPCPFNCLFCSLTEKAGIFKKRIEFTEDEIMNWADMAVSQSADALNIMTTGTYAFEKLLEIGRLLKKKVSIPIIANTRDINHQEGESLLNAGFSGAYHAVRLDEGKVTPFKVNKRLKTIRVFKDVGLCWMNCVEPVGPEHNVEEILYLMFLAKKHGATYSGVMRRVNFPGSPMEKFGMISELKMAKMVAVSRLIMGDTVKAHCVHEPNAASLMAGANLFFPEVGASPRDDAPDTRQGRGKGIEDCRRIFQEMGWDTDRPSNCFEAEQL